MKANCMFKVNIVMLSTFAPTFITRVYAILVWVKMRRFYFIRYFNNMSSKFSATQFN